MDAQQNDLMGLANQQRVTSLCQSLEIVAGQLHENKQETIPIDVSLTTIPVRHQLAGEAKQTMMFRVAVRVRVTSNNS